MKLFATRFRQLHEVDRHRVTSPERQHLRLNRLERPLPWPNEIIEDLRAIAPFDRVQQYPDYPPFYQQLAGFVGMPQDRIVLGAGIEEHIRTLMLICAEPGETVAVAPWPSCAMFEVYARAFGLKFCGVMAEPGGNHDAQWLIGKLEESAPDLGLLILPNPGQPVETHFDREGVATVADWCRERGCVLALDEAYHGFGASTALPLVDEFNNVVVLRTFSKAFGCAGLRIGYAVGGEMMSRTLHAIRQSGEVSSLSMYVASVLMQRFADVVEPAVAEICDGRDWLRQAVCDHLMLNAWGSVANHVLIEFDTARRADHVVRCLADCEVYVKGRYPGTPVDRHVMVTCGPVEMMERFFVLLRACLA